MPDRDVPSPCRRSPVCRACIDYRLLGIVFGSMRETLLRPEVPFFALTQLVEGLIALSVEVIPLCVKWFATFMLVFATFELGLHGFGGVVFRSVLL